MVYLFIVSRDFSTLLQMKAVLCPIARQVCMKLSFTRKCLLSVFFHEEALSGNYVKLL